MKAIDWIFIGYFLIGLICGIIAVRVYTKKYGKSSFCAALFVCNLVAWWIVFPDQMIELRKKSNERNKHNIRRSEV